MNKETNRPRRVVVDYLNQVLSIRVDLWETYKRLLEFLKQVEPEFCRKNENQDPKTIIRRFGRFLIKEHKQRTRDAKRSVYIIGNVKYGLCKIGTSTKPEKRLRQLQTGCPFDLTILA